MYCKSCGKEIDNDSVYCSFCGTKQFAENKPLEIENKSDSKRGGFDEEIWNYKRELADTVPENLQMTDELFRCMKLNENAAVEKLEAKAKLSYIVGVTGGPPPNIPEEIAKWRKEYFQNLMVKAKEFENLSTEFNKLKLQIERIQYYYGFNLDEKVQVEKSNERERGRKAILALFGNEETVENNNKSK
ncbi:zinc-ribbon domain-containing protein [Flavisolibacter tropicus]|uniref:Zinc-ribbon domain-containing protein n=1 Tax=Flavisolibacter tropicus TaxID=1492898 RepID=A0A172TVS2_9BACT|nr:zinc-ribbon domain-containing protein [Flavisolibacter tropicus]ANE51086.1 hypothetical protein SY85_11820 [Flavisolibacter tropicus]